MADVCIGAVCNRGHATNEQSATVEREESNTMVMILTILAVLTLLGAIPAWPHSRNWGYGPSGGLGLVLLIVVILLLTGRI
jgi:hypothetical protein